MIINEKTVYVEIKIHIICIHKQNSLIDSMASGIVIFLAVKGHITSRISGLNCIASSKSARRIMPAGLAPKTPLSCNHTPTKFDNSPFDFVLEVYNVFFLF